MNREITHIELILIAAAGLLSFGFAAFLYFARDKFSSGVFGS